MWSLPAPTINAGDAFNRCASKISDIDLRSRLLAIQETVVTASEQYEDAASGGQLHTIAAEESCGNVSKKELISLYKSHMVRKDASGRDIYEAILSAAPFDRCPLCGQRRVSTLDHHLPKSKYPIFSVTPSNLVPSCKDCNFAKLEVIPATAEDVMLHPYYDQVDTETWLLATVVVGDPCALRFSAVPPDTIGETLAARVRFTFQTLRLGKLYSSHAAEELVNIKHQLGVIDTEDGVAGVRNHLLDQATKYSSTQRNSWQTAMYSALSTCEWYCAEGFRCV